MNMTTKTVRIMFYDQQAQAFVVDTMEVEEEGEEKKEDTTSESQNERRAFSFSTLL